MAKLKVVWKFFWTEFS